MRRGFRERFWRWLARRLTAAAERATEWAEARDRARHLPPGTVVRVVNGGGCSCAKGLAERAEWAISCWNGSDYSVRGIGSDGVASFREGMEYACDRVQLEPTGRVVRVEK